MDLGKNSVFIVTYFFILETDAQEFCDGKYWCDTGHCCGEGRCCAYYYELWWFWLIWGVVILMSCCCLYQQRRIKQQHQQNLAGLLPHPQTSGHCHHFSFLPSIDRQFFSAPNSQRNEDFHLPSYEEAKHLPRDESPPAYDSLFSQTVPENPGVVTHTELLSGSFAFSSQSCPPFTACSLQVEGGQDGCNHLLAPVPSNTSDRAGLLENEEADEICPPSYSEVVQIAPS